MLPRPHWGAYNAPPDRLAVFKGPTSKGREGKEGEGKGREKGSEGEGKVEEGRGGLPPSWGIWIRQ